MGTLEALLPAVLDYGLAGIVIAGLFAALFFMIRTQSQERREWREQSKDQFDRQDATAKETNAVVRELTAVVESINRRQ